MSYLPTIYDPRKEQVSSIDLSQERHWLSTVFLFQKTALLMPTRSLILLKAFVSAAVKCQSQCLQMEDNSEDFPVLKAIPCPCVVVSCSSIFAQNNLSSLEENKEKYCYSSVQEEAAPLALPTCRSSTRTSAHLLVRTSGQKTYSFLLLLSVSQALGEK